MGFRLHVKPGGEFKMELVSVIVPENPPSPLEDIVDVAATLARLVTDVGDAEMAKSHTVYWMPTECESVPLVPLTVTL